MESLHAQDPQPQRDSGVYVLQARDPTPLENRGAILQLNRQIMKVSGSDGVNMEEFLIDIFKSKRKSSYTLILEVEEPTSFQKVVDLPNHKEWKDTMKDEMDSMHY